MPKLSFFQYTLFPLDQFSQNESSCLLFDPRTGEPIPSEDSHTNGLIQSTVSAWKRVETQELKNKVMKGMLLKALKDRAEKDHKSLSIAKKVFHQIAAQECGITPKQADELMEIASQSELWSDGLDNGHLGDHLSVKAFEKLIKSENQVQEKVVELIEFDKDTTFVDHRTVERITDEELVQSSPYITDKTKNKIHTLIPLAIAAKYVKQINKSLDYYVEHEEGIKVNIPHHLREITESIGEDPDGAKIKEATALLKDLHSVFQNIERLSLTLDQKQGFEPNQLIRECLEKDVIGCLKQTLSHRVALQSAAQKLLVASTALDRASDNLLTDIGHSPERVLLESISAPKGQNWCIPFDDDGYKEIVFSVELRTNEPDAPVSIPVEEFKPDFWQDDIMVLREQSDGYLYFSIQGQPCHWGIGTDLFYWEGKDQEYTTIDDLIREVLSES